MYRQKVKKTHQPKKSQKGGALSFSHLPCNDVERVQFQANKPTCHLWNTPQCGYGCGTCAGSDACMNYPFGQVGCNGNNIESMRAPVCDLHLDLAQQQSGAGRHGQNVPQQKICVRRDRHGQIFVPEWGSVPNTMTDAMCTTNDTLDQCGGGHNQKSSSEWFSQQCGNLGDCSGSGTHYGCGGGTCQDCIYYSNLSKNYRHMLTGALYPFCKE